MKKILVPTDFSECAEYALKAAAQVARKDNSEIFLLHMLELPGLISGGVPQGGQIPEAAFFVKKAHNDFQVLKERPYLKGLRVGEVIQFSKAFDGILKFSQKENIDLIVMGSHGASGLEDLLIGSNTEKVVRLSDMPVLVIKKEVKDFKAESIVFASNFTHEVRPSFRRMLEFRDKFNATVHLTTICTPNDFKSTAESEKHIQDFLKEFKLKDYTINIYNDFSVEKGVLNFTERINADLIAICTHKHNGLAHFFNGSISEEIVNHSSAKSVITFRR